MTDEHGDTGEPIQETTDGRYDLVPPHSIEAEVCVLGAMILKPEEIPGVRDMIGLEDLYRPAHRVLWQAICAMTDDGVPVDLVTLRDRMLGHGTLQTVGGMDYVVAIVEGVPSGHNAQYYAKIVLRDSVARQVISGSQAAALRAYNPQEDVQSTIGDLHQKLYDLARRLSGVRSADMMLAEALHVSYARLKAVYDGEADPLPPMALGFEALDNALAGGLLPGELCVVAGDTGSGKSTLSTEIARHIAAAGGGVMIVSGEMSAEEIAIRFARSMCKIHGASVRKGILSFEQISYFHQCLTAVWDWRVKILGRCGTIADIGTEARAFALHRGRLDLLIIDYLQLVKWGGNPRASREERTGAIANEAKALAADLKIPILLLAQLNREGKKAAQPPDKHSLRDSGQIEDAANVLVMLHDTTITDAAEPQEKLNANAPLSMSLAIRKSRDGTRTPWHMPGMALDWYPAYAHLQERTTPRTPYDGEFTVQGALFNG